MKKIFFLLLFAAPLIGYTQPKAENIIIITTDGFRWQEVFKGMDSAIANNKEYNEGDSAYIFEKYWAADEKNRRKKLLPFLWNKLVPKGQIYGNRSLGNQVDNANPFWFSYPGYSEIMTGWVDTTIDRNDDPPNPNITILEYMNQQPGYKGRVAAFGAWDEFDSILNDKRSGIPVVSGFNETGGKNPNAAEKMINAMLRDSYKPWRNEECLDVFTHYAAMEHLKTKKPRILYIAYGETDEWAHAGRYRSYLDAAHQVDDWISQVWNWIQQDPQYKNKTALWITTDHGRGDIIKDEWRKHNNKITDSHEIWCAVMGPGISIKSEVKNVMQVYQQQFAQTIARILGHHFKANHPVAKEVESIFK